MISFLCGRTEVIQAQVADEIAPKNSGSTLIAQNESDNSITLEKRPSRARRNSKKASAATENDSSKKNVEERKRKAQDSLDKKQLAKQTRTKVVRDKAKEIQSMSEGDKSQRAAAETAISRVAIPRFVMSAKVKKVRSGFKSIEDEFQSDLVARLNSQSYFDVFPVNIKMGSNVKGIKFISSKKASDAVLTGSVDNRSLSLTLHSGHSGRTLLTLIIPLRLPMDKKENYDAFIEDVVQTLVNSIPYRGYLTEIKGDTVKLNIGRHQALKKGDILRVFEFKGEDATLTSPKTYLGKVEITQLTKEAALGKLSTGFSTVNEYAKLDFEEVTDSSPQLGISYFPGFWLGAGAGSFLLDTRVSGTLAPLAKRVFQVTLTPEINLSAGYSRLFFDGSYAVASNSIQSVTLLTTQAHFQWVSFQLLGGAASSSVGIYFSSAGVALADTTSTATLLAHTETAPSLEARLQYAMSPRLRVFGLGRLRYPLISSDAESGTNEAISSFGMLVAAGFRVGLMESWAVENAFSSEFRSLVFPEGSSLTDLSFIISLRVSKEF